METIADRRQKHADWARDMAAQHRRDAANTLSDYWKEKWLNDARKMDFEAAWADQSSEFMSCKH